MTKATTAFKMHYLENLPQKLTLFDKNRKSNEFPYEKKILMRLLGRNDESKTQSICVLGYN